MKSKLFPVAVALLLLAGPSFADGEDTVDAATKEKVTALLVAQGYDVRKIEHEGGLIEVYVVKDGKMEELFFDADLNPVEHAGGRDQGSLIGAGAKAAVPFCFCGEGSAWATWRGWRGPRMALWPRRRSAPFRRPRR